MKFKTDFNSKKIFSLKKGPVRWALLFLAIIISIALKFYFSVPVSDRNPRIIELKNEWLACSSNEECVAIYNGCEDVAVNKKYALEVHKSFINLHNLDKSNCEINSNRFMNVTCQGQKCLGIYQEKGR